MSASTYGEQKYGDICIGPIPSPNTDMKACEFNPEWCKEKHEHSIQIDNGTILSLPYGENKKYEKIETGKRHLIKIRDKGNIIESFWFSFEEYHTESLCVWFNDLYLTWSMWRQKNGNHLCKCE